MKGRKVKKFIFTGGVLLSLLFSLVLTVGAFAAPAPQQDTCPEGGDWVKVDGIDAQSYSFDPPEGFTVGDNCYKAGNTLVSGSGDTVESTVWNKEGCPDAEGCNYQNISHASFELIPDEDPEPERNTDYDWNADCDGWVVTAQDYEDGEPIGGSYTVDQGTWDDPNELEEAHSQYIEETIYEPNGCAGDEGYYYADDPDCEGWTFWFVDGEGNVTLVEAGQWTDPNTLESETREGDGYSFTFNEPEGCDDNDVTPTPTRPRNDPPLPPQAGGGWEMFILGGGLLTVAAIAVSALRRRVS